MTRQRSIRDYFVVFGMTLGAAIPHILSVYKRRGVICYREGLSEEHPHIIFLVREKLLYVSLPIGTSLVVSADMRKQWIPLEICAVNV